MRRVGYFQRNYWIETADDSAVQTKITALNKCIQQFIGSNVIVCCLRTQSPLDHINCTSHEHKRRGAQSSVSGLSLSDKCTQQRICENTYYITTWTLTRSLLFLEKKLKLNPLSQRNTILPSYEILKRKLEGE